MPFLKPKTRARYMPKRKRVYKKRRYPLQKFKPVRGMTRAVMPFTREVETYFHLSDLTGNTTAPFKNFQHTTDGGVVGQISLALEDLPSHSDFTNLFRQYKLNYMKIIMIPAANTTLPGNTTAPFKNFQHTTDGGVVGQISLALEDLPSHSDFTNLFRQYKLNYMKIIMIPAANTTLPGETRDEGGNYSNNQILIRTMFNRTGIAIGAGNTISEWSQVQAKKQWVLARDKPTVITCKLSQLSNTVDATTSTEVSSIVRPRYISTNNTGAKHYGLNIRFDSLNGNPLSQSDHIWPRS